VVDIYYYEADMVWCVQSSILLELVSYSLAKGLWRPLGLDERKRLVMCLTLKLGALSMLVLRLKHR